MEPMAPQALRELALESAWTETLKTYPRLKSLNRRDNIIRTAMWQAINKVFADGATDLDMLVSAAMAVIPRRPDLSS